MTPRNKDVEPLDRERIVEAAMTIIDQDGLDALSMRRLGAALGVNPMAAYYHVPNKAALYDLVVEAIMAGVDLSAVDPAAPLVDRLKQAARALSGGHPRPPSRHPRPCLALAAHGDGAAAGRAAPRRPLRGRPHGDRDGHGRRLPRSVHPRRGASATTTTRSTKRPASSASSTSSTRPSSPT